MKLKKKKILLIIIICLISCFLIFMFNRKDKNINFDELENELNNKFDNLIVYDQDDLSTYFGFDSTVLSSSLAISDYDKNNGDGLFDPNFLVIVINSKDSKNYYNILKSYLDSNINNRDKDTKVKLYYDAILKKKGNIVYLILSSDNKKVEDIIKKYL